jgi:aryl-alcohol dehydrogenase-like predicted oxidoreductase
MALDVISIVIGWPAPGSTRNRDTGQHHFVTKRAESVAPRRGDPWSNRARVATCQKPWIVPIPATTKLHRLEENIGAAAVELTPEDLRDIETAASKITIRGARYPEQIEQMSNR